MWIHDLSVRDPYFVLPLLMGATMIVQYKLNPMPPDPIQAKIMMALPVVFTFFFAFFPSGLVLYWLVNNLLSIAQQWVITRKVWRTPRPPAVTITMMDTGDTIVAIATPPGRGALGVVRVSGADTFAVAQVLLGTPLPPPRHAALRRFSAADGHGDR